MALQSLTLSLANSLLWSLGPTAENVPNFRGCTRLVTHVLTWDVVTVSIEVHLAALDEVETGFRADMSLQYFRCPHEKALDWCGMLLSLMEWRQ